MIRRAPVLIIVALASLSALVTEARAEMPVPVLLGTAPNAGPQPFEQGNELLGSVLSANAQAAQYTKHVAVEGGNNLFVTLVGFYEGGNFLQETAAPDYTAKVSIEIPAGSGNFVPLTCGGSTTCSVTGGVGVLKDTDPLPHTFAPGEAFGMHVWVNSSGTNIPSIGTSGNNNTQLYTDEGAIFSTTVSSTPTNSISDNFTRRRRLTVVGGIYGQLPSGSTSVSVIGDSQQAYQTGSLAANSATPDHARGDICRSILIYYTCWDGGIGGDQPSTRLFSASPGWYKLASRAGVIVSTYGINEFNNVNMSALQALAFNSRIQPYFSGLRFIRGNLTPRVTATTDNYQTEANQTAATYSSSIDTFNTTIAADPHYIDRRTPVQGVNADKWIVNGTSNYATLDGLHQSLGGLALQIATAAAQKAAIDATPVSLATQPGVALTLGSTPTFSGGKFVRGTANLDRDNAASVPATCNFWFSATANGAVAVSCGGAGGISIAGGVIKELQGNGGQVSGTTNVLDGVERQVELVTTAAGTVVYLNGTAEITSSWTPGAAQHGFTISATVAATGGTLRELASFVGALHTANFTPPASPYTGAESNIVGVWHLTTDGSGVLGNWYSQGFNIQ